MSSQAKLDKMFASITSQQARGGLTSNQLRAPKSSQAWDVWLKGKHHTTVYYDLDMSADEIKRSLINHDGFPPNIMISRKR